MGGASGAGKGRGESTSAKIKCSIIFIQIFFLYDGYLKKTNSRRGLGEGFFYFLLFHRYNNLNIIYKQFYCCIY